MSNMEIENFGTYESPAEFFKSIDDVEMQLRQILEHVVALRSKLGLLMQLPDNQGFALDAREQDCSAFPYLQRVINVLAALGTGKRRKPIMLKYETVTQLSMLAGRAHERRCYGTSPHSLRSTRDQLWLVGVFLEQKALTIEQLVQELDLSHSSVRALVSEARKIFKPNGYELRTMSHNSYELFCPQNTKD